MVNKYLTLASVPLLAASLCTQAATTEQLNRQVQKLNQRISEQDNRFRVNGFATFGVTQSDEAMQYNDIGDEASFGRFSKIGVQMTFNLDSQNSVVTQFVSRGTNSWDTKAEWAYFKHDFNNGFTTKMGRIRLPAYGLSEFLDVGFANPYAQIPAETYDSLAPFSNMDGADLSYSMDVGDNTLNLQLTYGQTADDEFALQDIVDFSVGFQADTWNSRLAYGEATLTVVSDDFKQAVGLYGGITEGIDATFASLGFTYDPGDLFFTAEATQLAIGSKFVDADAVFATVGYRIGRFLPTITFATAKSTDDSDREMSNILANAHAVEVAEGTTLAAAIAGGLLVEAGVAQATAIALTGVDNAAAAVAGANAAAYSAASTAIGTGAAPTATDIGVLATSTTEIVKTSDNTTWTGANIIQQDILSGAQAAATGVIAGSAGLQAASNRNTQRIGLALKYDMAPGTALNVQYDIITVDDESGLFDDTAWATNAASGLGANPDSTNILTISIDTVF